MNFKSFYNSILKENESISKEDRLRALKTIQKTNNVEFISDFIDDHQPGVNIKYKGRPFSIWWIYNEDVMSAILKQATPEQKEMIERLKDILDNLIDYADRKQGQAPNEDNEEELEELQHNNEFGFIDYGYNIYGYNN